MDKKEKKPLYAEKLDHGEYFSVLDEEDKPAYTITISEKSNYKVIEYFIEEIQDKFLTGKMRNKYPSIDFVYSAPAVNIECVEVCIELIKNILNVNYL